MSSIDYLYSLAKTYALMIHRMSSYVSTLLPPYLGVRTPGVKVTAQFPVANERAGGGGENGISTEYIFLLEMKQD